MKYCSHCGNELDDNDIICPQCGCECDDRKHQINSEGDHKLLYSILSFIFPIIGLVLYIIYKDTKPNVSKSCGICGLIGFVLSFVAGAINGVLAALFGIM